MATFLKNRWTLTIGFICGIIMASLVMGYYHYQRTFSTAVYPVHISIYIDYGNGVKEEYRYIYCNNTPLAALASVAKVKTGEEWGGLYVYSVNGITGYKGGEGWYWIYYVNGKTKWDPINNPILREQDEIKWKREYYG